VINRLMDVALKRCHVTPGELITERSYGTLEVHGPDQGQVREAGRLILQAAGVDFADGLKPHLMTDEVIRQVDSHHAMLINRTRSGMLLLANDTLYTLECNPAVWVLLAANEAEKAAPIRIVGLGAHGAVGRLRPRGHRRGDRRGCRSRAPRAREHPGPRNTESTDVPRQGGRRSVGDAQDVGPRRASACWWSKRSTSATSPARPRSRP
jgi:hypothetical protein